MWGFQTKQSGRPSSQQDRNCPKAADSPISIVSPFFKLTALNCYDLVCFSRSTICLNDQAQTAWIHFLIGEYLSCRWITVCSLEHPPDFLNIWSKSIWKRFPCIQEPLWGIEWGPALPQMISMIRQCADVPGSKYKKFELRNMEPQNRWEYTDTPEVQTKYTQTDKKYTNTNTNTLCIFVFLFAFVFPSTPSSSSCCWPLERETNFFSKCCQNVTLA